MRASVVTHCDSAPIFEAFEHEFDFVSLFVEDFIVIDGDFAVLFSGDAGCDSFGCEGLSKPVGIISAIIKQFFGLWQ